MKLDLAPERLRALPVRLIEARDGVIVKRGRVEIQVSGSGSAEILRLLLDTAAGGASRDELLEPFPPPERPSVEALIDHFVQRRLLVAEDDPVGAVVDEGGSESPLEIFYWHFGASAAGIERHMEADRVAVLGVNEISRRLLEALAAGGAGRPRVLDDPLLRGASLYEADELSRWGDGLPRPETLRDAGSLDPQSISCLVVTANGGAGDKLAEWNEYAVLHQLPFLPVWLQDLVGYIGPFVRPGESACFECLRARQNSHLLDPTTRRSAEVAVAGGDGVVGFHPSMASMLGDMAALELTKHLGFSPPLGYTGVLTELNPLGNSMVPRRVLRLPRCPVCSTLDHTPPPALTRSRLMGQG